MGELGIEGPEGRSEPENRQGKTVAFADDLGGEGQGLADQDVGRKGLEGRLEVLHVNRHR